MKGLIYKYILFTIATLIIPCIAMEKDEKSVINRSRRHLRVKKPRHRSRSYSPQAKRAIKKNRVKLQREFAWLFAATCSGESIHQEMLEVFEEKDEEREISVNNAMPEQSNRQRQSRSHQRPRRNESPKQPQLTNQNKNKLVHWFSAYKYQLIITASTGIIVLVSYFYKCPEKIKKIIQYIKQVKKRIIKKLRPAQN